MKKSERNENGRDQRLIERFLEMMSAERGAARNTLAAYERDLEAYAAFLGSEGTGLQNATSEHIRNYLAALAAEGLKASSAARKLSALRQFHNFLYGEGIVRANPATAIDAPRLRRPLPKVMTADDVTRLISAAETRAGRMTGKTRLKAVRLHCLLELLYATGLRVSELVALKRQAVAKGPQFLVVKGKGGRERLVPVSGKAAEAVKAYLQALTEDETPESPWLFPSHGAAGYLTRQHFALELKALAVEAGLGRGEDFAACAAPRFCQPPARRRRRSPRRAANARPCRYFNYPDLYPYRERPIAGGGRNPSSAGEVRLTSVTGIATLRRIPASRPS